MSQFVLQEILNLIQRHISLDDDTIQDRLSHAENTFRDLEKIRLLKVRRGFVKDKRNSG